MILFVTYKTKIILLGQNWPVQNRIFRWGSGMEAKKI